MNLCKLFGAFFVLQACIIGAMYYMHVTTPPPQFTCPDQFKGERLSGVSLKDGTVTCHYFTETYARQERRDKGGKK